MTSPAIRDRTVLARLTGGVNSALERHFWRWASVFLVLFLACTIATDLRTKMWVDELYSLYTAKQSGPAEIIKAIREGCDSAPPLYAMIVHSILPVVKHEALAVRLPATLGYCAMLLCVLAFCRRRLPAVYSFGAALFACDACLYYSTEGRAYGMVLGCAAGALLCWQTAAENRRRGPALTLFALLLALMVALHYYSIFFLVPLFLAEMVRARASRELDIGILAAMLPAVFVLGLHFSLIAAAMPFQAHFWASAGFDTIRRFYFMYLFFPLLFVWPPAMIVLAFSRSRTRQRAVEAGIPVYEWVAVAALALMPAVVIVLSMFTTHVFVDRYALWAVIGFALLASALVFLAVYGETAVGLTMLGVLIALTAQQEVASLRETPVLREGEAVRRELDMLPDGQEPIVIASHHVFMELSYYAEPRIRERLIYPVSSELDLRYLKNDTGALLMSAWSRRTNLHIKDYAILAAYPRFLLAANSEDYLPSHLAAAGYRVTPVHPAAAQPVLFEVEATGLGNGLQ